MMALILSILQLLILVGMVYVFDNHIYVYTGGAYKKAHVNNFLKILTFVAGCIPIVGYNMGAGRKDRVKSLFTQLLIYEALVGVIVFFIVEFLPGQLIMVFGAAGESVYYTEFALKTFRI